MDERKLVTVARVSELRPIDGADRIEVAKVRNWNVVVGRGAFKVLNNQFLLKSKG